MKSLFLRIFLWFCGGSAAIVCVVAASFWADSPGAMATNWRELGQNSVVAVGRIAIECLERDGPGSVDHYLRSVASEMSLRTILLDSSGRAVGGSGLASNRAVIDALRSGREGQLMIFPLRRYAGVSLRGPGGGSYLFLAALPRREMKPWASVSLVLFIVTGCVLCYLLARHLSSPVVHLRAATFEFSRGDLGARITSARVLKRKDEIGGLARDFSHMAARIEILMKAQQRLIADASHELRSPLTRLGLALSLLRRNSGSAPGTSLARMEREVERLNALITQLLTLSRLECLDQPPPMEVFDLSALVQEIASDVDFEAANFDRAVRLVECKACCMRGAPDLVRSAIENVVRNAVRYTQANSSVLIRLVRTNGSTTAAVIVEDDGPGVPESELVHVFEPFYRIDEARERNTGGAGLGLAITHRVAHLHGGSVAAANRPPGGLELRITLPVEP